MNHGSLFTGIGGFDLAAEWMGWNNLFHVELLENKRRWLKHRWPNAESHADATITDFSPYRSIGGGLGILTGGDPCQVSSKIGKREGMEGALYLWPHFFRAVREAQPFIVVNENVDGTISNGILDRKIDDLESIGYTCWAPLVIPASFCGAHHRRDRVWLVAYAPERRLEGWIGSATEGQRENKIGPITALVENKNGQIVPKPEFLQDNDGLSDWVDEIQGYGNAIVPQVAFKIFQAIEHQLLTIK